VENFYLGFVFQALYMNQFSPGYDFKLHLAFFHLGR